MSTQDKIQRLTESLLKLSSSVALSDAIDSDSDKNAGIAASPKAVSTLASVILDAAKNASEGSDGENEIYEPFLEEVKHEIGSWWFSIDGSIPTGGLPHLGHLVSRSAYGTGWTWIETNKTVISDEEWLAYAESHNGTCPYYSYGDGSTTFRTPSYDQSFLKVLASISGTGNVEEAGLPNITGGFSDVIYQHNPPDIGAWGAFSNVDSYTGGIPGYVQSQEAKGIDGIYFKASLSNTIYGNSDTVTPQNYGIIVGIYLVGAVSAPIGETDIAGLLNGLSTLEGRTGAFENGIGRASAYITETWSSGTSWYRKWSDGWIEQGGIVLSMPTGVNNITLPTPYTGKDSFISLYGQTTNNYTGSQNNGRCGRLSNSTIAITHGSSTKEDIVWLTMGY